MLFCDKCWTRIQSDEPPGSVCPLPGCGGKVVHVDDNLGLAVRILNLKGYRTTECSSGHPYGASSARVGVPLSSKDDEAYITFQEDYRFPFGPPKGFLLERVQRKGIPACTISRNLGEDGPYERQLAVWRAAKAILEWTMFLPDRNATQKERK